ncbi:MAG: hypothetical protein CVV33_04040 [Methanomicrobiales archaeon HGW-Methanomicrobiales-4]|nr:MAG: hypothetical protein CVV33_04040 [Methanomicrobiales archaeon HGW-Methanomicrobiales-4]
MKVGYIIAGLVVLMLSGLTGIDYMSTSISTDGTCMLAGFGHTDNGTYASRVMTVDQSEISRSILAGEGLETDISIRGTGPVLVSEYASGRSVPLPDTIACVFLDEMEKQAAQRSEMYAAGILNKGTYTSSRVLGTGLTGGTDVNGSGMLDFGSRIGGNTPVGSRGFVAGNMTVRDFLKFGGKL